MTTILGYTLLYRIAAKSLKWNPTTAISKSNAILLFYAFLLGISRLISPKSLEQCLYSRAIPWFTDKQWLVVTNPLNWLQTSYYLWSSLLLIRCRDRVLTSGGWDASLLQEDEPSIFFRNGGEYINVKPSNYGDTCWRSFLCSMWLFSLVSSCFCPVAAFVLFFTNFFRT